MEDGFERFVIENTFEEKRGCCKNSFELKKFIEPNSPNKEDLKLKSEFDRQFTVTHSIVKSFVRFKAMREDGKTPI
jgi:hypothetical protein